MFIKQNEMVYQACRFDSIVSHNFASNGLLLFFSVRKCASGLQFSIENPFSEVMLFSLTILLLLLQLADCDNSGCVKTWKMC